MKVIIDIELENPFEKKNLTSWIKHTIKRTMTNLFRIKKLKVTFI